MGKTINESFLNNITQNMTKNKSVFGATLCVENGDNTISWVGGAGNLKKDDQYFIASVTKLCITAILLRLREENHLQFNDEISQYLSEDLLTGLHVLNGVEYTKEITIAHRIGFMRGSEDD